ncbi:MAG: triphosphoribosyl-dephospho-CoA synthase [Erysipelotrichaceae bacterium]|nr:triphosphoribosyl-dephospho-CoA synthase [Erysipelotrichaceae bacterium]
MPPVVAKYFENLSYHALVEEVLTTPKPGLVDLDSSGAHKDMDISHFLGSASAISPYFGKMAEYGYHNPSNDDELFRSVQKIGIEAEVAMYEATGGINTHKGAIFCIGLLVTAAGCLLRNRHRFTLADLSERVAGLSRPNLECILREIKARNEPVTQGEFLYCLNGISGARGEALRGFPSALNIGVPAFKAILAEGYSYNEAKIHTLLSLMVDVEDTTVLAKAGSTGMNLMKNLVGEILQKGSVREAGAMEHLNELDSIFSRNNISAGGCADLLGLTILIHRFESDMKAKKEIFTPGYLY